MTRDNGKPYWYWQNLTKDDEKGKFPWHGRGWYRFNSILKASGREIWADFQETLNIEWNVGRPRLRLDFGIQDDPEETLSFAIGFLFAGIHVHLDSPRLSKWIRAKAGESYESKFSFYWYEWAYWLQLWGSDWSSSSSDPWYKKMHVFHIDDFFLGKTKYTTEEHWKKPIEFEFDGQKYQATATFEVSTWKRPRWFSDVREYMDISFDSTICAPPQFAGKGENSWDQGNNSIWGTRYQTDSIDVAIDQYRADVLKNRKRYGAPSKIES